MLDGIGGAALLAALGLLLAWAFGAAALNSPGPGERDLRHALQGSRILTALNSLLPPSGPLLNVLRHIDPTPAIRGPNANVGAPEPAIADDPDVQRAGDSVVKVLGTACGLGIEGSGWVAGPGLVVTNAHVVAGEDDTTVTMRSGGTLDASAVHYEPRNDLAILRVAGLGLPALPLAPQARPGTAAAVLGYPENGPLTISPARVGSTGEVISQDSYGRGPVRRKMTPFRGQVRKRQLRRPRRRRERPGADDRVRGEAGAGTARRAGRPGRGRTQGPGGRPAPRRYRPLLSLARLFGRLLRPSLHGPIRAFAKLS